MLPPTSVTSSGPFLQGCWAILTIVVIDVILAGDNAVVIALAVRKLEKRERWAGTVAGAVLAVVARIGLTLFAAEMLAIPFLRIGAGLLILWIAIKLVMASSAPPQPTREAGSFWSAVGLIVVADITMSIDNVVAVAGAAKGSAAFLIFGLCFSIPLVVLSSNFISRVMDRHPCVIWIGAAILGEVAGEMMVGAPPWRRRAAELGGVVLVLGGGALARRRRKGNCDV